MSDSLHSNLVSTSQGPASTSLGSRPGPCSYRIQSDARHPPSPLLNRHLILCLSSMDRSSTPSTVLEEVISPVLETVSTDKAPSLDFEVTATFKLSNIKQYFEDDPAATAPPAMLLTPVFGPQLELAVCPSPAPNDKGIAACLFLTELNPALRPMFTRVSLKFSADAEGSHNIYSQCSDLIIFLNELGGRGWNEALPAKIWKAEEPLRRANAVYLLIKVVGSLSQTPTSRSPPVLNLLHETIVEAPRSGIRFTVFDCRDPVSNRLTNPRVVSADREIIKDTCFTLFYRALFFLSFCMTVKC